MLRSSTRMRQTMLEHHARGFRLDQIVTKYNEYCLQASAVESLHFNPHNQARICVRRVWVVTNTTFSKPHLQDLCFRKPRDHFGVASGATIVRSNHNNSAVPDSINGAPETQTPLRGFHVHL